MYIYDALACISPLLHAFAKKGTKAKPYVEQAYPINKRSAEETETKKERLKSREIFVERFCIRKRGSGAIYALAPPVLWFPNGQRSLLAEP